MEAKAVAKYIRISPRKARLVADMIRGKSVIEAVSTVRFCNKKAAGFLGKVLLSAVANAKQTSGSEEEVLTVKSVFVDEGPTLKRFMPRAMGRATRIRKRTSHITIVVDDGGIGDFSPDQEQEQNA
ncbi:MAG: 50S ribosomal protein L22 [Candidatus Theseobacter exili]|nr:50S ribosomal protein L22 [Candidatus Theseobacter exili]